MNNTLEKIPNEKRRHAKLGFRNLEAALIIQKLNLLIANYTVHYQKLRGFHWNIVGDAFFELHDKFEEQYDFTKGTIDELAERIRVFGKFPDSTLQSYLDMSEIKEVKKRLNAQLMVSEVLNDFEILLTHLTDAYDTALEIGDMGTTELLKRLIAKIEKDFWMYSSFNKKTV